MSTPPNSAADILAGVQPAAPDSEPATPVGNLGLLAGAKAERNARVGKERLTLWVPGDFWHGRLAVRLKPIVGEADERLERNAGTVRTREEQEGLLADLIVAAVDRFLMPSGGQLVPLEVNGRGATWAELANTLGVDITTEGARGVILHLFTTNTDEGPQVNGRALARFAGALQAWTADTSAEIDGAIVGESSA